MTSDTHNGDVVTRTLLLRHPWEGLWALTTDHRPMLAPGTWHRVVVSVTPDTAGAGGWHLREGEKWGVITTDYSGTRGSREQNETENLPELLTLLRAAGAESWEHSSPFHSLFCEISSKYRGHTERISKWSIHSWSWWEIVRGSIYRTVVTEDEVSWHIIVTPDLWSRVPPTARLPSPALPRHGGTAPGQPETDGGAHSDHNDAPQSPAHVGCQALPALPSSQCPQESVTIPRSESTGFNLFREGMKMSGWSRHELNYGIVVVDPSTKI